MSTAAKISLLFVVFIDLLGQGLVFPIINALIMEPSSTFLPHDASDATRHTTYGLVIGIFFLLWFLGAPYISKLSDVIGRKNAILICLIGALAGYAITIVALYQSSLTTAVFTLVAGVMSLLGGELMSIDIRAPFYIVIATALIGAVLLRFAWRTPDIRQITDV